MGRPLRNSQGGYAYHVVQRGCKIKPIFRTEADYAEFEEVVAEMHERFEPRILAYCALPKHWHMIVVPRKDGELSKLVAWMSITHSSRWHTKPRRAGTGSIYVRRFKSFPIQDTQRLVDVVRFVESHPVRAKLAERAEQWRWSSLHHRQTSSVGWLASLPVALPEPWLEHANASIPVEAATRILKSIEKGTPYGEPEWVVKTATKLGMESTLRSRGRPKTKPD